MSTETLLKPSAFIPTQHELIEKTPVTIAYGDGIGPEIMAATLAILTAAGARISPEPISIGEKEYLSGNSSGIPAQALSSLRRTKVFL